MNPHQSLLDMTTEYLDGIYTGNVDKLREVFHPGARIEDMTAGTLRSRSVDEYVEAVASRQSPFAAGEAFTMAPLSIQLHGTVATVTAELRFLGNHFINILSVLRCENRWRIAHKLFGRVS